MMLHILGALLLPLCGWLAGDAIQARAVQHLAALQKCLALLERIRQEVAFRRADLQQLYAELCREGILESGGMRQRVMIAMALACNPKILIADEPTTALDVTIQAQILDLMRDLQKKMGMAIIMITHDIEIARHARRIVRILDGEISEGVVEDA